MKKYSLFLILLLSTTFTFAQNKSSLSLTEIMKGNQFVGHLPQNIHWDENSQDIYFSWNPEDELVRSLYQTNVQGQTPQKVSVDKQKMLPSSRGGVYIPA